MNEDSKKLNVVTRRSLMIGIGKISVFVALLGRMFYLQVIKRDEYKNLADHNSIRLSVVAPVRGKIIDRNKLVLASNAQSYKIMFDKNLGSKNYESIVKFLSELLELSEEESDSIEEKILESPRNVAITLYSDLTWEELVMIEERSNEFPSLYIETDYIRYYPYKNSCAHLTGYMGFPSNKKNFYDLKIGKTGVERILENTLRGIVGFRKQEVNAKGKVLRDLDVDESAPGDDVQLTIDAKIQEYMASILPDSGAIAVLLDLRNGDIIGMHSTPSFDPNILSNSINQKEWDVISNNPFLPLMNKSISMIYPPGSTFKLVTALAALDTGHSKDQRFFCPGYFDWGGRRYYCTNRDGHGNLNLQEALMKSCNPYFWNLALKLDINDVARVARELGFGGAYGLPLPMEHAGLIPDKTWKMLKYGKKWQMGDSLNMAIGQGYVAVNALQLTVMTACIASGGKKVMPRLIRKEDPQFHGIAVSQNAVKIVQEAMAMVVNSAGTGTIAKHHDDQYIIAGKTGTAQVAAKKNSSDDYSKDTVSRKIRNHGIFVGYAPVHEPRHACCVIAEHGGRSSVAAAFVKDILLKAKSL